MMPTMKAVVQNGYGPPLSVLSFTDNVTRPILSTKDDHRVLVKVMATTVNTPDWAMTLGLPYLLRLASGFFRPKRNKILGTDLAGIVQEVGTKVTDFKVGDHVFGSTPDLAMGCFAEYVVVDAKRLCHKPQGVSFEQAAACVMSGCTALCVIRDGAKARTDQHILINGASGSVGTFALQMAKAKGATVTAVCSGKNAELVKSLGADHVIDYTQTDYTDSTDAKYDVILDNVMNHSFKEQARVLKTNGFVIPNGIGVERGNWLGAIPSFIFKPRNYPAIECDTKPENLKAVADMVESGQIKVVIDKVYSLQQGPHAVAYMASHRAKGNVVIRVSEEAD